MMMYLNKILTIVSSNNNVFYIVVVILVFISLLMFSLIYSQNREIKETLKRKQIKSSEQIVPNEPFNIYQEQNIITDSSNSSDNNENIPETNDAPELIELTDMTIPNKLEYTQALWQKDFLDLESISKELETNQKEQKINMTRFEAEQEENAIISYDELINSTEKTSNNYFKENIKSETTNYIQDKDNTKTSYEHEDAFLKDLKSLKDSLI